MHRIFPYFVLFAVTALLQVYLFDNLSISIYLNPLVYIAFLILLPFETPPVVVLAAGLLSGVTMDFAMGAAGINTIATVFVAFLRPMLAGIVCGRETVREGGVPAPGRISAWDFVGYTLVITLIHHALFFSLEALSWVHLPHTLLRIVVSSAVTVVFVWFAARIFTVQSSARL